MNTHNLCRVLLLPDREPDIEDEEDEGHVAIRIARFKAYDEDRVVLHQRRVWAYASHEKLGEVYYAPSSRYLRDVPEFGALGPKDKRSRATVQELLDHQLYCDGLDVSVYTDGSLTGERTLTTKEVGWLRQSMGFTLGRNADHNDTPIIALWHYLWTQPCSTLRAAWHKEFYEQPKS